MTYTRKSPDRAAVEAALIESAEPLTADEVAEISGVERKRAHAFISALLVARLAHNTKPAGQHGAAYAWGAKPIATPAPRTGAMKQPPLELPRPIYTRPGSMDAYSLPSMFNGERMQRKAPMLIGSRVTHPNRDAR